MLREQDRAPLFEAICKHAAKEPAGLHIPGHGRGRGLPKDFLAFGVQSLFSMDLTELPGLDDLNSPQGVIAGAQELAAKLYGADRSFFLVNGSTAGIQAMLIAAVGQGKVVVPRNVHRSVISGMVISGADPLYVSPRVIPDFGIDSGILPEEVGRVLEEFPDAAAVLAVRPNYYGVAGHLAGIVQEAHKADKPLLVDEAHGAHLRFHRDFPRDSMALGADACVQSTHKLGGSLGQSSLLHIKGTLLDAGEFAAALRLLQTTSPSYILMASLDLARRQMAKDGEDLIGRKLELARWVRKRLAGVKGIDILSNEHLNGNSLGIDETKLVVSVRGLGLTGYQASSLLAERYNVFVEMADAVNVVAFISIGTDREDCESFAAALEDIAARDVLAAPVLLPEVPLDYKKRMTPREAWFSPAERVPLAKAGGRICAEAVAVYPPGIPAINPGEEITPEIAGYLFTIRDLGLNCQGPTDRTLNTIKVVVE